MQSACSVGISQVSSIGRTGSELTTITEAVKSVRASASTVASVSSHAGVKTVTVDFTVFDVALVDVFARF